MKKISIFDTKPLSQEARDYLKKNGWPKIKLDADTRQRIKNLADSIANKLVKEEEA